jgi:hypothetical protein
VTIYDYDFARLGGFIVVHHRYDDTLYFGPFRTHQEAQDFCKERADRGLRGGIIALQHPKADPAEMWDNLFVEVDSREDLKPLDTPPDLPPTA